MIKLLGEGYSQAEIDEALPAVDTTESNLAWTKLLTQCSKVLQ
jgi:hypothetical protein